MKKVSCLWSAVHHHAARFHHMYGVDTMEESGTGCVRQGNTDGVSDLETAHVPKFIFPLQQVEKTMVELAAPLRSMEDHDGVDTHNATCGQP